MNGYTTMFFCQFRKADNVFDFLLQGCRIPVPNLYNSGFFAGRQADLPIAFVHGELNFGARKKKMLNFNP